MALAVVPTGASAAMWTSEPPGGWNCGPRSDNGCVAHTGFNPNEDKGGGFGWWGQALNPAGNCTNYAAYRLAKNGATNILKPRQGDAINWKRHARNAGKRVDKSPAVGAIAWWGTSKNKRGHVAYVEKVSTSGTVYLSDSSYLTPTTGRSQRYTLRRGSRGWPEAFLHIKDKPAGNSPIGRLERVEGLSNSRVRVTGWALDPDRKTAPVRVEAWIDGKRGQAGARKVPLSYATLTRKDVARVHRGAGARHGFKKIITRVSPGTHAVRVYALNRFKGGGTTYLGGKTVRVPTPPPDDPVDDDPVGDDPVGNDPVTPVFRQSEYTWAGGDNFQSFMGDFNGDNQVDVGLRRISDGTFYWRLGPDFRQGQHTWSAGVGAQYQSFMGDFNGDNQVDVGLRRTTDGTFYWRLGPGFQQSQYAWAAGGHFQSFMGDFNGDGQVDVGLRRTTDGAFYWRLGPDFRQGQHTWSAGVGAQYQSFMGDFNGDNQVDVGLRRTTDGTFYWRFGPSFAQGLHAWSAGVGAQYQSFMGDFNGDNQVDVGLRRTTDGVFYWRLQARP